MLPVYTSAMTNKEHLKDEIFNNKKIRIIPEQVVNGKRKLCTQWKVKIAYVKWKENIKN